MAHLILFVLLIGLMLLGKFIVSFLMWRPPGTRYWQSHLSTAMVLTVLAGGLLEANLLTHDYTIIDLIIELLTNRLDHGGHSEWDMKGIPFSVYEFDKSRAGVSQLNILAAIMNILIAIVFLALVWRFLENRIYKREQRERDKAPPGLFPK